MQHYQIGETNYVTIDIMNTQQRYSTRSRTSLYIYGQSYKEWYMGARGPNGGCIPVLVLPLLFGLTHVDTDDIHISLA